MWKMPSFATASVASQFLKKRFIKRETHRLQLESNQRNDHRRQRTPHPLLQTQSSASSMSVDYTSVVICAAENLDDPSASSFYQSRDRATSSELRVSGNSFPPTAEVLHEIFSRASCSCLLKRCLFIASWACGLPMTVFLLVGILFRCTRCLGA